MLLKGEGRMLEDLAFLQLHFLACRHNKVGKAYLDSRDSTAESTERNCETIGSENQSDHSKDVAESSLFRSK